MKLEASESVIAPKLRTGRFKATDKLLNLLKATTNMRNERAAKQQGSSPPACGVRIKMDSAGREPVLKSCAVHEFHEHQQLVVEAQRRVQRSDIRMLQSGEDFDLIQEAVSEFGGGAQVRQQYLHRFRSLGDEVADFVPRPGNSWVTGLRAAVD